MSLKKIGKFLSSMQFAILLLIILATACSVASFVTQGQSYSWYAQHYSERTAALIIAFRLDDAFHSWWFLLITGFLCLNLLFCNIFRLPQLLQRVNAHSSPPRLLQNASCLEPNVSDPYAIFRHLRLSPIDGTSEDGRQILYASKNSLGLWGAWVCHLGILFLIAGFSLGQITQQQETVYGIPGQSKPVGDSGLILTIDDFRVELRDDDTVEQYTADLTVHDTKSGGVQSASASVNYPATLFGWKFYQNSTGWAELVTVTENGEFLQNEVLCAGEYLRISDKPDLVIYFNAFYPDYVLIPGIGPQTLSGQINNPATLYSVYYQEQILGMNVLMDKEELTIDEYTVVFSEPQPYTLIQVKKDSFTWLAFLGGIVTMLGLVLAFYIQPFRVWAVKEDSGMWTVYGSSPKGGLLFKEKFERAAQSGSS
ncbi:MAG: cytochrome c biogenesis protein ResB [Oscillospiraceae bacterium]|nr:cytochrome c biogenesis protein ResB [Oscillospiraceae bacterium]